jgi:hypothetical protein
VGLGGKALKIIKRGQAQGADEEWVRVPEQDGPYDEG